MSLHLAANEGIFDAPTGDQILAAIPFAAYTTDPSGQITAFNPAAVEMWGRTPEVGELWCGSHKLFWTDGTPMALDECPMAQSILRGEVVRGAELVLERPDGTRVSFAPYPSLLRDGQGRVCGAINILVDISSRIKADRANAHYAAIVESSEDAIISKDLNGMVKSWNQAAERVFGFTAAEAIGKHISILIPEDRLDEEPGIIARIRRGERIEHYETIRQKKDGTRIDVSLTVSPVKDVRGQVVGASKIARDISEQKRAEAAKELLLHEIKHRVKNTLGTVQAIAAQTFREGPKSEREAFGGRLRALSSAHDILTQHDWDQVSLQDMIGRALSPFRENRVERFRLDGEDAILGANRALLLAMAIHELATNAVKYGALSGESGTVSLSWRIVKNDKDRKLALEWREQGGPPVLPPSRKGFGSTLIERAVQAEQGRSCLEFRPEGVLASLDMAI